MDGANGTNSAILIRFRRPPWIMAVAAAVLVVGVAAGWWLIAHTKPTPAKYRQGLDFALYYPTNLPSGYAVDTDSFQRKGKVLIFNITTPVGKAVSVSEEHIPAGLDLSQQPNPGGVSLPDQRSFTTGAGSAEISLWGDKLVSSLVTANTWVIINVTGLKMDQAQQLTQAFTKI